MQATAYKGNTASISAALNWTADSAQMAKNLLERGLNVNARDFKGYTLLLLGAIANTDPEFFRLLIDAGAYGRSTAAPRSCLLRAQTAIRR